MVMDLYLSNSTFQPSRIIDNYSSLVWTDRYAGYGDFTLSVPWSLDLSQNLKQFKYLLHPDSNRVMMVETVEKPRQSSDKAKNLVKCTGRSIEAFLDFRNNKTFADQESVVKTGSRAQIANEFVDENCVSSAISGQNLPGLVIAAPPSGSSVTLTVPRGPIYSMVKEILQAENLGFKIYRTTTAGELIWEVYEGADYSGDSDPDLYREFSPETDSLSDTSSLESISNYKNHILAIGAKASTQLYYDDSLASGGWNRRSMVLDALDVGPDTTTTVAEDQQALILRMYEAKESTDNKYIQLVDGQIPDDVNVDLGDIVWVKDSYGMQNLVRITEMIYTSDATGSSSLPTFEAV